MSGKQIYDVVIVGAGASGMIAAITAAKRGKQVLIIEQKDKIGKKIFATGNGKCNYTNADMDISHFHGNEILIKETLRQFSKEDCLSFFRELGIYPKNKNGYFYPNSEQAASIVHALELEIKRLHIMVFLSEVVEAISKTKKGFQFKLSQGTILGKKVIIATGLLASPKLGSDGSIFPYIKSIGHHFSPITPALCGYYAHGIPFKKVSGVRCEAKIDLWIDNKPVCSDQGELQLTDYGISGIPVFQISHEASLALYHQRKCSVMINFIPTLTFKELETELTRRCSYSDTWLAEDILNGLVNQKLGNVLLGTAGISIQSNANDISYKQIQKLCHILTELEIILDKSRDFEFAQVCTGGIRTDEIDVYTLESQFVPDLFFAGELLDVDGICGGYNLQWAWSSGYVAGKSASE